MNKKLLNKAIKIAKGLPNQKYKLVAIITDKKGNILSIGKNSFSRSHPTQAYYAEKVGNKHKIFIHSEIDALVKCKGTPYNIYVVRINKKGKCLLAKPCSICEMAIKDSGIKNIYYTEGEK